MYKLKELPYLYQDLEPYIKTHTMGLHYHKHAENYLNKLNQILTQNNYKFNYQLNELLFHIDEFPQEVQEDILFNLGGVINHNLYFYSIGKDSAKPEGLFKSYLERKYQNLDNFFQKLKEKALKLKGSGYTFLVINAKQELDLINLPNQQTPWLIGNIPLFCIDLWEHAYYLTYENDKEKYIDNFIEIADFSLASKIFNNSFKAWIIMVTTGLINDE